MLYFQFKRNFETLVNLPTFVTTIHNHFHSNLPQYVSISILPPCSLAKRGPTVKVF